MSIARKNVTSNRDGDEVHMSTYMVEHNDIETYNLLGRSSCCQRVHKEVLPERDIARDTLEICVDSDNEDTNYEP